ncbi:MAG: Gfo/Idh/MocA family oxidoreductase, partial [Planctomycetes bacterium]|nr:Gfo/Idh/MocA family oxidoreductase [Planctomycetota bacterium]
VGVVGYGPAFNMGKHHLNAMKEHKGLVPFAVCDLDEQRLAAARQDFPGIETYNDLGEMLRKSDVQLLAIILPHNVHAKAAIQCLNAGRHVVVEKPFAITVDECDAMIAAARKNKVMLSTYHNRHWDANILTIMKHLDKIGRPFRWESFSGGYSKPRPWWRSDKKISGGTIYDWGAHFTEWMLQVMRYDMIEISGFHVWEVWTETTNEDEVEAVVRFKGNAVASHTATSIAMSGKPAIRICGTKGAITADHSNVTIHTLADDGSRVQTSVPMEKPGHPAYYANVRDHLLKGEKLTITAELARRVIQVLDYACRSAKAGKALKPKYK